MPDVLVRDVGEDVVAQLKQQAARHGRSMQAELKAILEQSARTAAEAEEAWAAIDRFRERLTASGRRFSDSADLVREDRNR